MEIPCGKDVRRSVPGPSGESMWRPCGQPSVRFFKYGAPPVGLTGLCAEHADFDPKDYGVYEEVSEAEASAILVHRS